MRKKVIATQKLNSHHCKEQLKKLFTSLDFADKSAEHDQLFSAIVFGWPKLFLLQMQPESTKFFTTF